MAHDGPLHAPGGGFPPFHAGPHYPRAVQQQQQQHPPPHPFGHMLGPHAPDPLLAPALTPGIPPPQGKLAGQGPGPGAPPGAPQGLALAPELDRAAVHELLRAKERAAARLAATLGHYRAWAAHLQARYQAFDPEATRPARRIYIGGLPPDASGAGGTKGSSARSSMGSDRSSGESPQRDLPQGLAPKTPSPSRPSPATSPGSKASSSPPTTVPMETASPSGSPSPGLLQVEASKGSHSTSASEGMALEGGGSPSRGSPTPHGGGESPPGRTTSYASQLEGDLRQFINGLLSKAGGVAGPGFPITSCKVYVDKLYAFLEFRSVEEASNCMALDGALYKGHVLRVRRPNNYDPNIAVLLGVTEPDPAMDVAPQGLVRTVVPDSPHKLFLGGLPCDWSEEQVKELLAPFGALRAFNLVQDKATGNSKGYAFCEYADVGRTDYVIQSLNAKQIGKRFLTAKRAVTPRGR